MVKVMPKPRRKLAVFKSACLYVAGAVAVAASVALGTIMLLKTIRGNPKSANCNRFKIRQQPMMEIRQLWL
jgi:negative regulator of sigma E activity